MEPLYGGIAITSLIIIVLLLIFSRRQWKQRRQPSDLAMVGMTLVVLGIIFGNTERFIGYSFIGVGVILSVIDGIRNRESK